MGCFQLCSCESNKKYQTAIKRENLRMCGWRLATSGSRHEDDCANKSVGDWQFVARL